MTKQALTEESSVMEWSASAPGTPLARGKHPRVPPASCPWGMGKTLDVGADLPYF